MVVSKRAAKLAIRTRRSSRGLNRVHESFQLFTLSKVGIDPRLHREIATTTTTLERTEWRALYLSNEWWGDLNRFCRSGFPLYNIGHPALRPYLFQLVIKI